MQPVFSGRRLQSQGSKLKLPLLKATFLQWKNFGHLFFCYWQVSFYCNETYTVIGVQTFKSTCE
jgi:hypothetical protein